MIDSSSLMIQTVKGLIPGNSLGYCQSHEHLFIKDGYWARLNPSLRIDDFDRTLLELESYRNSGGVSIVDAQPVGCGRMAEYLYKASVSSGINIIASTGFHKLAFYPENHWIHNMDEFQLADLFRSEIEYGMLTDCDNSLSDERIPARAGIIKTASDIKGPSGKYRKLFEAAAKTSNLTGSSILSHTEMGKGALEQIELLTSLNVPPDSIIICHIDRNTDDFSNKLEVAKTGVYMEFDTIGRLKYHSDEDEAGFIIKMIEHGYEDKVLISLDTTRERLKSYGGLPGLDHILTAFIQRLRNCGLSDEILKKITVSNPAKALAIKKNEGSII